MRTEDQIVVDLTGVVVSGMGGFRFIEVPAKKQDRIFSAFDAGKDIIEHAKTLVTRIA